MICMNSIRSIVLFLQRRCFFLWTKFPNSRLIWQWFFFLNKWFIYFRIECIVFLFANVIVSRGKRSQASIVFIRSFILYFFTLFLSWNWFSIHVCSRALILFPYKLLCDEAVYNVHEHWRFASDGHCKGGLKVDLLNHLISFCSIICCFQCNTME